MSSLNDYELDVVNQMNNYGGSFVKALANCFYHADHVNKEKLKEAFQNYWKEYSPDKRDNNLTEQADQDYKEKDSFTGDACLK